MNLYRKKAFGLILIFLAICALSYVFTSIFSGFPPFRELLILSFSALCISLLSLFIFFRGYKTESRKGVLFTLLAISLKFLLFLALIGIFAIVNPAINKQFLYAFFTNYLAFTFFLLLSFVNILKSKNQEKPDAKGNTIY